MPRHLMSINDLYDFCVKEGLLHFSAEEYGKSLKVQVPLQFTKIESDEYTLRAYVKFLHTGKNKNLSILQEKAAKHCMDTLAYKPILAAFTDVNGEWDFTFHDFVKTKDEDGNKVYIYNEKQVGCFTADKPYMEYDKEYGHDYLYAQIAIPREYTKAAEIIERKNGTKISAELEILEMSYSASEKALSLDDAIVLGGTLLGVDPETGEPIGEGMVDAHVSLETFSDKTNSIFSTELLNELRLFNKNFETMNTNSKEGGKDVNKFEELLKQYNKTAEDVTFEYDGLSDDELVAKFAEAFGDNGDDGTPSEGGEPDNDGGEGSEPDNGNNTPQPSEGDDDNNDDGNGDDNENNDNDVVTTYSITLPDGTKKNFSLSMNSKINALYNLVNETYGEMDNEHYSVEVYDEDKTVVMIGWFGGSCYRQSYKQKKDNFSLEGDRVSVHSIFVTEDEEKVLNDAKAKFEATSDKLFQAEKKIEEVESKLSKFESEPEKVELLQAECYANIVETDEYKELAQRENYFELSKEELETKLDNVILKYAKENKLNFSAPNSDTPNTKVAFGSMPLPSIPSKTEKHTSRYGSIFDED